MEKATVFAGVTAFSMGSNSERTKAVKKSLQTLNEMEFVAYGAAGTFIALFLMVGCALWKGIGNGRAAVFIIVAGNFQILNLCQRF